MFFRLNPKSLLDRIFKPPPPRRFSPLGDKGLLVLMCLALMLSMASFANFAVLLPELTELWDLSGTEAGWISGIYFIGYVCAVPLLVGITDRLDAKKIFMASCVVGTIGSFGFAMLAGGFWTAMAFRFVVGISLAGTYMPGLQILNARMSEKMRQRAVPWYTSSFGLGTGGSYLLTGQLPDLVIWQEIFAIAGLLSLVSFALVSRLVVDQEPPEAEEGARHPLDFSPVFSNRPALAYILGYVGHSYELFAFRAWIVAFLVFAGGAAGADISLGTLSIYVAVFSLLGMPGSIMGAEWALRGDKVKVISLIMWCTVLAGAVLGQLSGFSFVIILLVAAIYSTLIMTDSAALTSGAVESAREGERGATLAVHSVLGFSGGFLGPLAVGVVLDVSGGLQSDFAWSMATVAMVIGSLGGLIALRMMMAAAKRE